MQPGQFARCQVKLYKEHNEAQKTRADGENMRLRSELAEGDARARPEPSRPLPMICHSAVWFSFVCRFALAIGWVTAPASLRYAI